MGDILLIISTNQLTNYVYYFKTNIMNITNKSFTLVIINIALLKSLLLDVNNKQL